MNEVHHACHLHATLRLLCAGRRATIDPSPPAAAPVSQAGDDKRWEVSLRENSSGKFLKFSEAKQSLWNKVSGTRALIKSVAMRMHAHGRVRLHAWVHAHACTPHAAFATASSLASCVSHPLNMIHTSACDAGDMWSRSLHVGWLHKAIVSQPKSVWWEMLGAQVPPVSHPVQRVVASYRHLHHRHSPSHKRSLPPTHTPTHTYVLLYLRVLRSLFPHRASQHCSPSSTRAVHSVPEPLLLAAVVEATQISTTRRLCMLSIGVCS
jgi:hypothetical protein